MNVYHNLLSLFRPDYSSINRLSQFQYPLHILATMQVQQKTDPHSIRLLYIPVRPHHVGQRDMSFTTPEANMSLKSSQRVSQKVRRSCSLTPRDPLSNVSGATRIQRNPVSRSKLSLDSGKDKLLYYWRYRGNSCCHSSLYTVLLNSSRSMLTVD